MCQLLGRRPLRAHAHRGRAHHVRAHRVRAHRVRADRLDLRAPAVELHVLMAHLDPGCCRGFRHAQHRGSRCLRDAMVVHLQTSRLLRRYRAAAALCS